jgi:error-prone DNA polymerase
MYTRILDFPRHLGQHSGGMVISWHRLDGIVPLEPASMPNRNIIQWDKDDCEQLKIVKVDLLGLGMMAVLRDSITLIREHHGEDLGLYKIPQDDPKVYEALQNADTVGMFQVESRAQIAFLPKSRPREFYDIVVQVAIIRPGPVVGKMLSSYIKRRQGLEDIDHIHPRLIPTLKRTLGVPLFQEQLLKIAMEIADFTGSEAEELRRAMGFKRPDRRMEKIEANLRAGMNRNDIDDKTQDTIVTCVKAFANYGFPESHAFSFALLAYASAYFMVHYRAVFMTAMFNNYPLGFYSAATLVKDAQRHGLHFLPLDINRSQYLFTVEEVDGEKQVRLGLKYVRGLRKEVGEAIVQVRTGSGSDWVPYTSVEDLVRRVPLINKREIRALSMAGALNFDNTVHRRQALWQSELAIQPPGDLFAVSSPSVNPNETPFLKRLEGLDLVETDLRKTGISIGKHPMTFIRDEMNKRGVLTAVQTRQARKGSIVSAAGAAIIRQRPMTAKNVVFITLEDETGHSNFVVMPDIFEKFREVITQNNFLLIKGQSEDGGVIKALYFEPIYRMTAEVVSHDFR